MQDVESLLGQDEGLDSISPYDQVVRQNLMHMRLSRTHVIVDGEWCAWREDKDRGIVIKREPWSLLGTGRTLNEAIDDFRREAGVFATIMRDDEFEKVTEEAWRMRDFVMRYLPQNA